MGGTGQASLIFPEKNIESGNDYHAEPEKAGKKDDKIEDQVLN